MQFSENSVLLNFYGGHKAVARPDPIPNSAVKHRIADGSACIACARVGCRRTFLITPFPLLTVFSASGRGVIYFTRSVVHCLVSQRRKRNFDCSCFKNYRCLGVNLNSQMSLQILEFLKILLRIAPVPIQLLIDGMRPSGRSEQSSK